MSTAGPNFPTSATGNTSTVGGGVKTWSNPTNIEASDSAVAAVATNISGSPFTSDDLIGTGFGFSIPSGATINGITLEINYKDTNSSASSATDTVVQLLKAGTAVGTNKGGSVTIPTTATTHTYGGSSDLWGTTWSVSDINNANFGAVFVTAMGDGANPEAVDVDFFRITVTYTLPPPAASRMMMLL